MFYIALDEKDTQRSCCKRSGDPPFVAAIGDYSSIRKGMQGEKDQKEKEGKF